MPSKRERAVSSLWTVLLVLALVSGCTTAPDVTRRPAEKISARPLIVPEKDRVLFDYHEAATALRGGDGATAKAKLDDAIARIGGIITNSEDARRSRSLFSPESTKIFIGEPYERVMAYFYRGILYWHDGQPDNARACFRTGQVIDSDPEGPYQADYVLLDYLDGFATAKLGGDGADAFKRAQRHSAVALPPYDPSANVLVFVEFGRGPHKYAAGRYGEQLRFYAQTSAARTARLVLNDGPTVVPLPAYDDLFFQAVTRGGRVMDHILGNKAVFKNSTDVGGDLALAGAVVAHGEAERREAEGKSGSDADRTAIGLGVIGLVGKVVSAATQPRADVREWDNLPQYLSFAALKLAPGEYHGVIEFLDRDGQVLTRSTQPIAIKVESSAPDTVVFLSELQR